MTVTYNDFQMKVWQDRYCLKDANGEPVEKHPNDTYRRVAKAIAEQEEEPKREHWQSEFYRLMSEGLFMPGGRVLSGAGSGHEVTYYNCYVAPSPVDSRSGIFDNLRLMADIMARGGGVGVNLSTIRPRGSYIKTVNGYASGPVSWAELYSVTTGDVISQGGSRRGALMLMLNDDHPDIEEFITAKRDTGKLQYCNMSVAISDAFMDAVKKNGDWHLKWNGQTAKTLKARDLWNLICKSAWESGEPGVVFLERYNEEYNGKSYGKLTSVNPCLSGDTLVLTPNGEVRLDSIRLGDEIVTTKGKGIVKSIESHHQKPVSRVTFANGTSLLATDGHQFFIEEGGHPRPILLDALWFAPTPYTDISVLAYDESTDKTYYTPIVSIDRHCGIADVYDIYEPEADNWITSSIVNRGCGEVGLEPYGVCNLGSINLAAHVKAGAVDYDLLKQTVRSAVRFLDNVIDATPYFLPENEKIQKSLRRVGLGSMGLADAMLLCKVKYGSQESLNFCDNVYRFIADQAYIASAMLARERGPFPLWTGQFYYDAPFISRLGDEADDAVYNYGLRNVAILAQAPTGTTSMLLGVSSGIEPNFAWKVRRKDRLGERVIYHPIYGDWMSGYSEDGADVYQKVPDYFVTAAEIAPEDHIRVQAMVQKYTDQSISKTINAPNSSTVEDVERAYMLAYDLGCKGVTYFRDGSREGVLSDAGKVADKGDGSQGNERCIQGEVQPESTILDRLPESSASKEDAKANENGQTKTQVERPDSPLPGLTYRVRVPLEDGDTTNVYITITGIDGKPVEVFLNSGASNRADHDIIARLVSHSLRTGVPLEEVIDNCWKVRGYVPLFTKGCKKPITCVANAIGYCLEHWRQPQEFSGYALSLIGKEMAGNLAHPPVVYHYDTFPETTDEEKELAKKIYESQRALFDSEQEYQEVKQEFESKGLLCPDCGTYSVVKQSGCPTCTNCAYSKCG
jgi:ribonucleotide reductase alpha subunit